MLATLHTDTLLLEARKDYQTCKVGPTRASPKNVNTNVLRTSSAGTRSITSWNRKKRIFRTKHFGVYVKKNNSDITTVGQKAPQ
jgi:hypothetical protein